MPREHISETLLNNYVYEADSDYRSADLSQSSMISFGAPSLFNHHDNETVAVMWNSDEYHSPRSGNKSAAISFTRFKSSDYFARYPISFGEEVFGTYGGEEWFTAREIPLRKSATTNQERNEDEEAADNIGEAKATMRYSLEELEAKGFCLSNVVIAPSTILLAGKGLFTRQAFSKGQVVTVSPVVPIPMSVIEESRGDSILINYVISSPGSRVALFPLGLAAMINHKALYEEGDEQHLMLGGANVEMQWLDWSQRSGGKKSVITGHEGEAEVERSASPAESVAWEDLFKSSHAQFDLSFIATRDIKYGEELFLNYGKHWEMKWNHYLSALALYTYRNNFDYDMNDNASDSKRVPLFREYTAAHAGLIPRHWMIH